MYFKFHTDTNLGKQNHAGAFGFGGEAIISRLAGHICEVHSFAKLKTLN